MEIENLELKLEGKEPVTREELLELVSSWGRLNSFLTFDDILIKKSPIDKCYPLENLDVSEITDLSYIFRCTSYNGDLSKWNVSSCTNMERMFWSSNFNNDSLNDWDVSNVKYMNYMFYSSEFNGDVSNWNISNVQYMQSLFDSCPFDKDTNEFKKKTAFLFKFFNEIFVSLKQCGLNYVIARQLQFKRSSIFLKTLFLSKKIDSDINKKLSFLFSKWKFHKDVECFDILNCNNDFSKKYNDNESIPHISELFLEWFEKNKIKIDFLNISKEEELNINDYLDNFDSNGLNNDK